MKREKKGVYEKIMVSLLMVNAIPRSPFEIASMDDIELVYITKYYKHWLNRLRLSLA